MSDDRQGAVLASVHALRRVHARLVRELGHRIDELAAQDLLALPILLHSNGATPGTLAEETGLTTGAVTSLIDRLETAGLVTRSPSPLDRRSLQVQIRSDAHARVLALMHEAHIVASDLFHDWSTPDIKGLAGMLGRLASDGGGGPR